MLSDLPVTGADGQDAQSTAGGPDGALRYGAGIMFDIRHGIMVQPQPEPWSGTTRLGRAVIVLPPTQGGSVF